MAGPSSSSSVQSNNLLSDTQIDQTISGWVDTVTKGVQDATSGTDTAKADMLGGSSLGGLTGFRESGARPLRRHHGTEPGVGDEDRYGGGMRRQ
jgi:hypothetical protein